MTRTYSTPTRARLACLGAVVAGLAIAAPANAADAQCEAPEGGTCGQVSVPLDRSDPGGAKVDINYVRYAHTDTSRPVGGTIFVTEGGPGYSVLNNTQGLYRQAFDPLLKDRDLVLIDQRGVGRSGAVDCGPLQQAGADIYPAAVGCGEQLGTTSDLYGSADVARDIEAVRAALGIETFDFYGGSYAGMDIQAYAARFPGHLRSVVLDSPAVVSAQSPWLAAQAPNGARVLELVCRRSANCSAAHPRPGSTLRWLIRRLRSKPVKGTAVDAGGTKHRLTVTEGRLALMLQHDQAGYMTQGEIPAAAEALRDGDPAPLLRLAAENDMPLFGGDSSPSTQYSVGDNIARYCSDQTFQWNRQAAVADRRTQFAAAKAALPPDAFAPFSVDAWVQPAPLGLLPDPCIGWPAPTHATEPAVPPGIVAGDVPALILTGDVDVTVPPSQSRQAVTQFPRSTVVGVTASGHQTLLGTRSDCAAQIISRFLEQLRASGTGCAARSRFAYPGVGRFTRRAGRSRAAIARAATATIIDAVQRSRLSGAPRGAGLRGGTFQAKLSENGLSLKLNRSRFASDLPVSGTAELAGFEKLDASLELPGGAIRVRGDFGNEEANKFEVTGTIGGRRIALSVPAT